MHRPRLKLGPRPAACRLTHRPRSAVTGGGRFPESALLRQPDFAKSPVSWPIFLRQDSQLRTTITAERHIVLSVRIRDFGLF